MTVELTKVCGIFRGVISGNEASCFHRVDVVAIL